MTVLIVGAIACVALASLLVGAAREARRPGPLLAAAAVLELAAVAMAIAIVLAVTL